MNILLVYATNSGGTFVASGHIADALRTAKHTVKVVRADQADPAAMKSPGAVILASCTWLSADKAGRPIEGQLQEHMQSFVDRAKALKLPGQKFAVLALGDSSYTNFAAAADHLESFVKKIGGVLVVPTMRIDGFFFDLEKNRTAVEEWAASISSAVAGKK